MKKLVTFLLAICIMSGASVTAFAQTESTDNVEALSVVDSHATAGSNEDVASERLIAALDAMEAQVDLTDCEISADDFNSLYFGVLYDHPEYFYAALSYRYSHNVETGMITTVTLDYLNMYRANGGYDIEKIAADRAKLDIAIDKAMTTVYDEMSDLEKVLAIHEYLGGNVSYAYEDMMDNSLSENAYTAYGALVDGEAVCQGYSLAFQLLCDLNDVEAIYVSSVEDRHGWNMVNLDGEWYHIDVTYNDPVYDCNDSRLLYSMLDHKFLFVSDADLNDGEHDNFARPEQIDAATPSATKKIEGIWNGQKSQMLYHDGYWFYIEGKDIVKSKIDGSDRSVVVENAGADVHLSTNGTSILFSTRKGVYAVNFDGSEQQELFANADERVHGLHYEDGVIYAEVHSADGNEHRMESIPFAEAVESEEEIEAPADSADKDMNAADALAGDVNGDGEVTVTDILVLKSMVIDGASINDCPMGDCDGDGQLSVSDILCLKTMVMAA